VPLTPEEELQEAAAQWLHARNNFHGEGSNGLGVLDGYWEAHRRLLAAFTTAGWASDDTKLIYDAYHKFLRVLVHSHEHAQEVRHFSRLT